MMMGVVLLTKVDKTTTPTFQTNFLTINYTLHSSVSRITERVYTCAGRYHKTVCTNKAETVIHYHLRN